MFQDDNHFVIADYTHLDIHYGMVSSSFQQFKLFQTKQLCSAHKILLIRNSYVNSEGMQSIS